jgi:hypothetical protein
MSFCWGGDSTRRVFVDHFTPLHWSRQPTSGEARDEAVRPSSSVTHRRGAGVYGVACISIYSDRPSISSLRPFDLEKGARNRCVVGRDAIELGKARRAFIPFYLGDHHRAVAVAPFISRSALDRDAGARQLGISLDVDRHVTSARQLSAVYRPAILVKRWLHRAFPYHH